MCADLGARHPPCHAMEGAIQPAGVTKGGPPTVENSARTVSAVTPTATVPIRASDMAVRTRTLRMVDRQLP